MDSNFYFRMLSDSIIINFDPEILSYSGISLTVFGMQWHTFLIV